MEFGFPDLHDAIDWSQPVIALDMELQQIAPVSDAGVRTVDKLVEVRLRISLRLEARHTVSRWREPPESEKYSDSGLKGRHRHQCVGPTGLWFFTLANRWLTPPALDVSALWA